MATFDPASEPLGSFHPIVRKINSTNFDLAMHSPDKTWIDRFNEIRKTWAAIETEIEGLLIAGGKIFETEAQGRAAADNGQYFFAESDDPDVSKTLYQRVSESESRWIADDPSAEFVKGAVAASTAALDLSSRPGQLSGEFDNSDGVKFSHAIMDENGVGMAVWDEDGYQLNQMRGDFSDPDSRVFWAITDENDRPLFAVDEDAQPIIPWIAEFDNGESDLPRYCVIDENDVFLYGWDDDGRFVAAGVGFGDPELLPINSTMAGESKAYLNDRTVSVSQQYDESLFNDGRAELIPDYSSVYQLYDDLITQYPGYISSETIGDDAWGNEIRKYEFFPPQNVALYSAHPPGSRDMPTIIITTGMHGIEDNAPLSLYTFFKTLCEEWQLDNQLSELRWKTRFVVIPVACPTGFNARTRKNAAGVDPMRNYPWEWETNGSTDPESQNYKGPSPASELETQHIIAAVESYDDYIFIDYHNVAPWAYPTWIGVDRDDCTGVAMSAVQDMALWLRRELVGVPGVDSRIDFGEQLARITGLTGGMSSGYFSNVANKKSYLYEMPAGNWAPRYHQRRYFLYSTTRFLHGILSREIRLSENNAGALT